MKLITTVLIFCSIVRASTTDAWADPGFELLPVGPLVATGARDGWEVQATGRNSIVPRLTATCLRDARRAHSGRQCLSLSIPQDTVGFEFVTAGRRLQLDADK